MFKILLALSAVSAALAQDDFQYVPKLFYNVNQVTSQYNYNATSGLRG